MPAKRERELEGALVSQFAGLTGDAIECAIRLEIFKSDGRRANPVPQAKNRDRQLSAAGGFDQMANHAFGPTDVELIDAIMEHLAYAGNFGGVVLFGPGSVGIDVADILASRPAGSNGPMLRSECRARSCGALHRPSRPD